MAVMALSAGAGTLPEVMVTESGEVRRGEMISLMEDWEYGHAPAVPEVEVRDVREEDVRFEKSGEWGTCVRVTLAFGKLTMEAAYWKPREAGVCRRDACTTIADTTTGTTAGIRKGGGLPAVLAMEPVWWPDPFLKKGIVERVLSRGFVFAGFDHNALASFEDQDLHPAQDAYPDCDWGVVAVGAWGYRVAMNWLETVPDVDAKRVAIWGHSRRGKSCAWAGALDERFAAVMPHMSGMAGTALYRVRGKGAQELEQLLERYWLHPRMFGFIDREDEIPFDQHWLHALIAPRPLLIHVGKEDAWGNPAGERGAYEAAKPVYELLGNPENLKLYIGDYGHHDPNGPEGGDSWEAALRFLEELNPQA